MIQLAAVTFGVRWTDWVEEALLDDTPVPALPGTDAEVRGVRVWQGLRELARVEAARGNEDVAAAIDLARCQERTATHRQLERWLGARIAEIEAARVCCLVDGLRLELASGSSSLSLDDARAILRADLDGLRVRTQGAA